MTSHLADPKPDCTCIMCLQSHAYHKEQHQALSIEMLNLDAFIASKDATDEAVTTAQAKLEEVKEQQKIFSHKYNHLQWFILNHAAKSGMEQKKQQVLSTLNNAITSAEQAKNKQNLAQATQAKEEALSHFEGLAKALSYKECTLYICSDCVAKLNGNGNTSTALALAPQHNKTEVPWQVADVFNAKPVPSGAEIAKYINQYVKGQNAGVKFLSAFISFHYRRVADFLTGGLESLKKSNFLIVGPTGCGKTESVNALLQFFENNFTAVPYAIQSATQLTEAGYQGADVEVIISKLFDNACALVTKQAEAEGVTLTVPQIITRATALTEFGIAHVDEIDKKASSTGQHGMVSRKGVQDALLALVESCTVKFNKPFLEKGGLKPYPIEISTQNILFIFSGAFSGDVGIPSVYQIAKEEALKNNDGGKIGFISNPKKPEEDDADVFVQISHENLVKYGMSPEMVRRFTNIISFTSLSEEVLTTILTDVKDAEIPTFTADLKKYYNITLEFPQESLIAVAKLAKKQKGNARVLKSIINKILSTLLIYEEELRELTIRITPEAVECPSLIEVRDPKTGQLIKYLPTVEN